MRFSFTKNEKGRMIGVLLIAGAFALVVLALQACGGNTWKGAALPSPVMVGDSVTINCPERMQKSFPSATFAEVTNYCLDAMVVEANRATRSTESIADAEGKKAERSCYGAFCGGHYGTMPVMRNGVLYSSGGGYNTVGGMLVQTGPSMRPQSAGRNIVPRSSPPPRRR